MTMTQDIRLRISETDKLYLEAKANEARLKLSSYVRHELLKNVNTNSEI